MDGASLIGVPGSSPATTSARLASAVPGQIPLRQHLAFFHRRLAERFDTEQMRRDDRLQHEMHQQFAEARLVEPVDVHRAHRAAVARERLGGRAALGRDEVADGLAAELRLARLSREPRIDARAKPRRADGDDGKQLVARTGDEKLELRMLVDGPERADRCGPLSVLAEALGPEL